MNPFVFSNISQEKTFLYIENKERIEVDHTLRQFLFELNVLRLNSCTFSPDAIFMYG